MSEDNSVEEYRGFDDAQPEIKELARTYSNTSSAHQLTNYLTHMSDVPGILPYNDDDVRLNPDSDDFDAKFWVKNLRKVRLSDTDYYKPSSLGVAYKNLVASGVAADSDYLATVLNGPYKLIKDFINSYWVDESRYFNILKSMDAIMKPGEVTVVLGRPGSGCTTLLKTIAAQTYGFNISKDSYISYNGLSPKDINDRHRGDIIYSAEVDSHFPQLSVGDTLEFAARMRTPQNRGDVDRETYAKHMAAVYMATYGLSHTRHTNVGNDFVRGVSGGERKRVSIAEASLSGASVQCWDNATRGLDAATALEFIRALKTSAAVLDATPLIAIYQCSQDAYDLFDNVILLYEGYQIFYGKASEAKQYFLDMGYVCPQRQTTADYLTSITNPSERVVKPGFEKKVPVTPAQFEDYWKKSPQYAALIGDIDQFIEECESANYKQIYHDAHNAKQANHVSTKSPYTVSFWMQTRYVVLRNFLRMKGDPTITFFQVFSQLFMGLVISSSYYNLNSNTSNMNLRTVAVFVSIFFNAFASLVEILAIFESRPIVEKHKAFGLYRPSADAFASVLSELPIKIGMSICFNFSFYFIANLRREPGRFFFYWLTCFTCTLAMSHVFRSIGAVTSSIAGAMTPATFILVGLVIYAGYALPTPSMLGWSRWINYLDPIAYGFEALMANEFHDREFECATYVPTGPGYLNVPAESRVCNVVGAQPGSSIVQGDEHIQLAYDYANSHKWRNWGIVLAFAVFFFGVYLLLTELNRGHQLKGEKVVFLRGALKKFKTENKNKPADIESKSSGTDDVTMKDKTEASYAIEKSSSPSSSSPPPPPDKEQNIFHWRDLSYQVKIKSEDRVLLNNIDGWVKPGQLTALMGSSGAGKTTLLNCLSERLTTGVVTSGTRMVNGHELDSSFQRSIGYAQQQDIHLSTSTVREALQFSAYLRQPKSVSKKEKDDYVDYVIDLLEMSAYADAIVGVAGEGLNVEQRKRLTIGVELAAKPKLLLFLDEPTSGLDSQTAWSVCQLLRKLANHGQAILCTIHQPSAILLQEFDRLLFLQKGGQTVYFGDLGENFSTLINYFEGNGAHECPKEMNPAEWMLHVVGAAPGSKANQDYFQVWRNSSEYQKVQEELDYMETELVKIPKQESNDMHDKYATSVVFQYFIVTWRVLQSFWRTPNYIYSKAFLAVSTGIFVGFSFFNANTSMQGLQNQTFAIFMSFIPLFTMLQQTIPYFIAHRSVYEVRESPSRTYSWVAFILSQISAEIPFQFVMGTLAFFTTYYPIGFYHNAVQNDAVAERGALSWLFMTAFYIFATSLSHVCIAFNEVGDNAANLGILFMTMSFNYCGVFITADAMPGFWIFMYRVDPFTYLIQGLMAANVGRAEAICSDTELLQFAPTNGATCSEYLSDYISAAGGYLIDGAETAMCKYCPVRNTDDYLASVAIIYDQRWRNYGIFIAFVFINIGLTLALYYLVRVPKGNREKKQK